MKFLVLMVGKTSEPYLKEGTEIYHKRLTNYISTTVEVIALSSHKEKRKVVEEESKSISLKILPSDFLVLLDEKGKEVTSRQLSDIFSKWMVRGIGRVVFVIGGPYGVSDSLKAKADY